jgi:hypothetical protein
MIRFIGPMYQKQLCRYSFHRPVLFYGAESIAADGIANDEVWREMA